MSWQDIATAPKDGTAILLGCFADEGKYSTRFPQMEAACWVVDQHRWPKGEWVAHLYQDFSGFTTRIDPTHWMPLPQMANQLSLIQ